MVVITLRYWHWLIASFVSLLFIISFVSHDGGVKAATVNNARRVQVAAPTAVIDKTQPSNSNKLNTKKSVSRVPLIESTGCGFNLETDLPKNQPLLIRRGGSRDLYGFYMPDQSGTVRIGANTNEEAIIACPGKNNVLATLNAPQTIVTCSQTSLLTSTGVTLAVQDLNCSSLITHSAKKNNQKSCEIPGTNLYVIDIGFELADKSFYTIMETCFDERNADAIYAKFIQQPVISAAQVGEPRPSFIEGSFYPAISVNSKYTREGQRATFATILGSDELAARYIGEGDYYLARGHLTARADFVYSSHQRATFWYVNVAPQWQTFNGGNWETLESDVRRFTASHGSDLIIYTGTHGIAKLPDVNNVQKPLYLHFDVNNNGQIKVPELFWKVLYDPTAKTGIAFVGINNPYLSNYTILCQNVCSQVTWLRWQTTNQMLGFGYCCNVGEIQAKIPSMPRIKVNGLLT